MPNYRRARVPGASYFFTVTLADRAEHWLVEQIDALRGAFARTRGELPFRVDAIVVLPDHLHCIWTLPPGDADFATCWRLIKTWFTKHCNQALRPVPSGVQMRRQEQALWQHRYWEHMLRDERDFERHVEYIHYNPVKHG